MSAVLLPQGKQQYFTAAGVPLVGGTVSTFDTGTTNPRTTWADAAQTSPNTNPIILDTRGEAAIFWSGAYRVVVKDALGNTIWTVDGVSDQSYTDSLLRADLLASNNANLGADLIGFAATVSYAGATVGGFLNSVYGRSSLEIAASVTPTSYAFPYGDPRRAPTFYADRGQVDYGDVPTYIDATHFSVPGDQTSRYTPFARVVLIGAASRADVRVVSAAFAAVTTVTISASETGDTVPNPILAVWFEKNPPSNGPSSIVLNANLIGGQFIINRGNSTQTAARTSWGTTDSAGVMNAAISVLAVSPNYVGAYLANGFTVGGRTVIYTPPSYTMEIGTSDLARILIPSGSTPINFLNDITVISQYGAATRAISGVNGNADCMFEMKVASVQKGYLYASATEIVMGSTVAIDVTILYNGARVLSFSGANATGASTPTLGANKPGSNSTPQEWLTCKNGAGATRYIPMWS